MIPPETVSEVRDRTDILAVIGEAVPSLKKRGRSFVGLCPFHKEKTGSFNVNPDRGFFHCFGCGEAGSVIDFVMKHEGATFPEAVRSLAERLGIVIQESKDIRAPQADFDRTKKQKDDLYNASSVAAHYFETMLRESPLRDYALRELDKRGLGFGKNAQMDEALQAFRIGYAPAGWDGLATYLKAQGISPLAGELAGLLVPRSSSTGHYDRFRHRLMFAVCDPKGGGRVVAFSGRSLPDVTTEERVKYNLPTPKADAEAPPKYINSPESPIYRKGEQLFGLHQAKNAIRTEESTVVVEGNFDVVALHARGLSNVVAPLGTAFTIDQATLLKRFATEVIFLFDADLAGTKAVRNSREPVQMAGLSAKVATLPVDKAKDPDELAQLQGIDAVKSVIANARGMLEWMIDRALDASFHSADVREKMERVEMIKRILSEEEDPLVRMITKNYVTEVAARIDLKMIDGKGRHVSEDAFRALEESVKRAMARAAPIAMKPGESADPPSRARYTSKEPGANHRAEIVAALLEYPELLTHPDVAEALALLEGNSTLTIAALSSCLVEASPAVSPVHADIVPTSEGRRIVLDTSRFLAQIPDAVRAFVAGRLAVPRHENQERALESLRDHGKQLKSLVLSQEADGIAAEQHRAAGDWDQEVEHARNATARVRAKQGVKPSE